MEYTTPSRPNCTAGKDRTGVLAAILLLRLGVGQEDIIADYQVSFTYNTKGINRLMEQVPQMKAYLEQAGEDSMLHSNPKNMQAVFGVLNADNIAQWLANAGVSKELQEPFCGIMLESADL